MSFASKRFMMKTSFSKKIRFRDGDGLLHGFSTGFVKVKSAFRTAKGGTLTSKIHFLLDTEWTEYMPIMVWVIDHPEGIFVVDTGENARVSNKGYFKNEGPIANFINTRSFQFNVSPEDEVGPQLTKLGLQLTDIHNVLLTHLHLDHFDGLSYFEETAILVNELEWKKPSFALPSLYPTWFQPQTVKLSTADGDFGLSKPIVQSGEIQLVHTPGHTLGHCSVLVKGSDLHYFLAGDTTYHQHQLTAGINAGGHQDFKLAASTYASILSYASKHKLIYLPSHDVNGLHRLEHNLIL